MNIDIICFFVQREDITICFPLLHLHKIANAACAPVTAIFVIKTILLLPVLPVWTTTSAPYSFEITLSEYKQYFCLSLTQDSQFESVESINFVERLGQT